MNNLAVEIERALRVLIGLRLSLAGRAADMRVFHFGETRSIRSRLTQRDGTVGEFALHVQCPWRIEGRDGIVTGRADLWEPVETDRHAHEDGWHYDTHANVQDKMIQDLFQGSDPVTGSPLNTTPSLVVENVAADSSGGVWISLSGGYRLCLFPEARQR